METVGAVTHLLQPESSLKDNTTTYTSQESSEVDSDLQRLTWKQITVFLISSLWVIGLLVTLEILILVNSSSNFEPGNRGACLPDGNFNPYYDLLNRKFNYWGSSGTFQITLGFGKMSFTKAKVLDVGWDVIVGRGGQTLMAWISWGVFTRYFRYCMEVTPVTFETYKAVFIRKEYSTVALCKLIRSFFARRMASWSAMVFIVMTLALALCFPTLASAMTGYRSIVAGFVTDIDGNMIQRSSFVRPVYIVHDGSRANWTDEFLVYDNDSDSRFEVEYYLEFRLSSINGVNVTGPPLKRLNITSFDETNSTWLSSNHAYNLAYLKQNGSCQATADYEWGFSYVQLFLMVIYLLIWTIGIFCLYWDTYNKVKHRKPTPVAGETKAILELADVINTAFTVVRNEDAINLHEHEIHQAVCKDLGGGSISYQAPPFEHRHTTWRQRGKRWLLATFLTAVVFLGTIMLIVNQALLPLSVYG